MGKAALIACLLLLASCASTRAPVLDAKAVWCSNNQPRRDATPESPRWVIDEINNHNGRGEAWCRWEP